MTSPVAISGLPFPLTASEGGAWRLSADAVAATATPRSDLFADPAGDGASQLNAVTLLGDPPAGDFTLRARAKVGFRDTFDAGVLLVWVDERHWAKLCFEYSPDREPMVVSVVTRGVSDDANGFIVAGDEVHLRVSRIGRSLAFHASTDGERWIFVRNFSIPGAGEARVGFEAQSPMGSGCDVEFTEIAFEQLTLADLRDGS
jgi:regulation of enolase protein 1 (concanavalin A-like superfamily)